MDYAYKEKQQKCFYIEVYISGLYCDYTVREQEQSRYSQLNNFCIHFRSYFGVSPGTMRSYDPLAELEDAYL